MAAHSYSLSRQTSFLTWLGEFLRKELAPYPGRGDIVTRMVLCTTVTAVLSMVFRIPSAANGIVLAFVLSRQNLLSYGRSTLNASFAYLLGGFFIPVGSLFFAGTPEIHFIWEAVSLFIAFFLMRTLSNYMLGTWIAVVTVNIDSVWYLPGPANRNVELSLWQVACALLATLVCVTVEVVSRSIRHTDEIREGVDARLQQVEFGLRSLATGSLLSRQNREMLEQYAVVGVGALRANLARRDVPPEHRGRTSALISLAGRALDDTAALAGLPDGLIESDRQRAFLLAVNIGELRTELSSGLKPKQISVSSANPTASPLLSGLESTVALIPAVLDRDAAIDGYLVAVDAPPERTTLFVSDAFTNPEHLHFALGGTFAAMICYMLYVSLAWPGIVTSVATCMVTALTTVGSSRQKQTLRIAGVILGGVIFGFATQIFVLPNINSIGSFVIMFATVTALAAWIATSSAKLAYVGTQMANTFYLIHVNEFAPQTSLAITRDRVVGVLLGISMMWLVFDRVYGRAAGKTMAALFAEALRDFSDLFQMAHRGATQDNILKIRRFRTRLNSKFADVSSQSDVVMFETGRKRSAEVAFRNDIRRWQTYLKAFYILYVPLLQHEMLRPPDAPATSLDQALESLRIGCSGAFREMADFLEAATAGKAYTGRGLDGLRDAIREATEANKRLSDAESSLLQVAVASATNVERIGSEVMAISSLA